MKVKLVQSTQDFVIVKGITKEWIDEAHHKYEIIMKEIGTRNTKLVDNNREIKFNGVLAEVVLRRYFPNMYYADGIDNDLIWLGEHSIECKTQSCNGIPRPDFVGCVWESFKFKPKKSKVMVFSRIINPKNKGQKPDTIIFTGMISTNKFLKKATLIKKGTVKSQYGETIANKLELKYTEMYSVLALLPELE